MAYTTIDDPSEYFTTTLYTGNGSDDRSIPIVLMQVILNLIGYGLNKEIKLDIIF